MTKTLACIATLALLLAPGLHAQTQTPAPSRVAEIVTLADGVHLLPGRFERGRQPDGNSLLLDGPEGIVVIDTGRHAEHTQALIDFARQGGRPVRAVINTPWHLDHLGGNLLLRQAWPALEVHASQAIDRAITGPMVRSQAELQGLLEGGTLDAGTRAMVLVDLDLLARRERLAPDRHIVGATQGLVLAGRALRVGVEADAVSGGDVWVLDRASGTLAAGDFVTLPVPFLDTACAPRWRDAMARLDALPFKRLVPGHGPVMDRDAFRRYRHALDRLLACAAGDSPVPVCAAGWIGDLGPLLPRGEHARASGMLTHYLNQQLRAAPAARDRFCPPTQDTSR